MKKILAVALVLPFALASCGGSDGGSDPTPASKTLEMRLVDGYLQHATVWIDTNSNFMLDEAESSVQSGQDGRVSLQYEEDFDANTLVVGKIHAGITLDTSTNITFDKDLLLVSRASNKIVSPFSTLEVLFHHRGLSWGDAHEAVCDLVFLDQCLLSQDHIANQDPRSTAMASTLMLLLEEQGVLNDSNAVLAEAESLLSAVLAEEQRVVNNGLSPQWQSLTVSKLASGEYACDGLEPLSGSIITDQSAHQRISLASYPPAAEPNTIAQVIYQPNAGVLAVGTTYYMEQGDLTLYKEDGTKQQVLAYGEVNLSAQAADDAYRSYADVLSSFQEQGVGIVGHKATTPGDDPLAWETTFRWVDWNGDVTELYQGELLSSEVSPLSAAVPIALDKQHLALSEVQSDLSSPDDKVTIDLIKFDLEGERVAEINTIDSTLSSYQASMACNAYLTESRNGYVSAINYYRNDLCLVNSGFTQTARIHLNEGQYFSALPLSENNVYAVITADIRNTSSVALKHYNGSTWSTIKELGEFDGTSIFKLGLSKEQRVVVAWSTEQSESVTLHALELNPDASIVSENAFVVSPHRNAVVEQVNSDGITFTLSHIAADLHEFEAYVIPFK